MSIFEFFFSLIATVVSILVLIISDDISSRWYMRALLVNIVLFMSYFAGLHGGVLK